MTPRRAAAAVLAAAVIGGAAQQRWTRALALEDTPGAPARLADTGLYRQGDMTTVDPRHRLFSPQYPLWTDGLSKRRWIHLPEGAAIDASDPYEWRFPVGTKLWKEFSLGGRKLETRMLWRASETNWIVATYAWNEAGTDAVLAPDEGIPGVAEVAPGRYHAIPGRTDCTACHGTRVAPLGFNALQLSGDRDPNAIHGEPLSDGMVTLEALLDQGLIRTGAAEPLDPRPRIRTSSPGTRAVLGYLASNCGSCHNGRGEISAAEPALRLRELIEDGDAVATRLAGRRSRWQIPGLPEGDSVLVHPGDPARSAILARMRSRAPSSQMPPLGTVLRDEAAVDALSRWISSGAATP